VSQFFDSNPTAQSPQGPKRGPWRRGLPVALIVGVVGAGLSSWYHERVPEDIQGCQ
jgi:hypothetical protein